MLILLGNVLFVKTFKTLCRDEKVLSPKIVAFVFVGGNILSLAESMSLSSVNSRYNVLPKLF